MERDPRQVALAIWSEVYRVAIDAWQKRIILPVQYKMVEEVEGILLEVHLF